MSFLDNLENNLKALEGQEQGGLQDEARRRDNERARLLASAPWAEQLKTAPYTKALMGVATRAGFTRRAKVHIVWLGTTLRFEAGNQRLELRPAPKGIVAHFLTDGEETGHKNVDLAADPQVLVTKWMELVDVAKKKQEAAVNAMHEEEVDE